MNEYEKNGYVVVRKFLTKELTSTISRYMEYVLRQDGMKKKKDSVVESYVRYADPLTEVLLVDFQKQIEEITGFEIDPTYSYSRVYVKGDELKPHTDRKSCEVSVTVQAGIKGNAWPIWMHTPGKEPVSIILESGDAVIYKGCEVTHWREKAINTDVTAQFMLHYINKKGPDAQFKWDKRSSLGILN